MSSVFLQVLQDSTAGCCCICYRIENVDDPQSALNLEYKLKMQL